MKIDVAITPAEILPRHKGWVFVVIDVLRATSCMITALDNGAELIAPVADYDLARRLKTGHNILLCGEEMGRPIPDFDLSNSPFEYARENVSGKILVQCTSNGTRAIAACQSASKIFAGAFINASAVCARLKQIGRNVLCVCAGESGQKSFEDILCAGKIVDELDEDAGSAADSARISYKESRNELHNLIRHSDWGEYIAGLGYEKDIEYCCRDSIINAVPLIEFTAPSANRFPVMARL